MLFGKHRLWDFQKRKLLQMPMRFYIAVRHALLLGRALRPHAQRPSTFPE